MPDGHKEIKKGDKIKSSLYQKIFFSVIFIAIIVLAFLITKPYISALLTGAILAYLCYPLYRKTLLIIKNKSLAALAVSIIILLAVIILLILVLGLVFNEALATYNTLSQQNVVANFIKIACNNPDGFICRGITSVAGYFPQSSVEYYTETIIKNISVFVIKGVYGVLSSIPSMIINFFVMIFVVYYLLKDGDVVVKKIKSILPLRESHKEEVFRKFHRVTFEVFYANISVALLQGVIGTIGFIVLGVHSPVLWGSVMTLFALVPYFGTALIWLPIALNMIFIGYLQDSTSTIVRGVILIIYGILIISTMDNILKPKLIGKNANVHPVLVLLGILGGLSLFGLIGLILGPVMLALLMTFVDIYVKEKKEIGG